MRIIDTIRKMLFSLLGEKKENTPEEEGDIRRYPCDIIVEVMPDGTIHHTIPARELERILFEDSVRDLPTDEREPLLRGFYAEQQAKAEREVISLDQYRKEREAHLADRDREVEELVNSLELAETLAPQVAEMLQTSKAEQADTEIQQSVAQQACAMVESQTAATSAIAATAATAKATEALATESDTSDAQPETMGAEVVTIDEQRIKSLFESVDPTYHEQLKILFAEHPELLRRAISESDSLILAVDGNGQLQYRGGRIRGKKRDISA